MHGIFSLVVNMTERLMHMSSHISSQIIGDISELNREPSDTNQEVARLTVHENDEIEFHWPLVFSVCQPVWQGTLVPNPEFFAYPMACPVEKAPILFKNMMFAALDIPKHIVAIDGKISLLDL